MRSLLQFTFLAVAAATSLRDILTKRSDLTSFADLLGHFEAWRHFEESSTNITVMAPNDAAYDKLLKMGLDLKAMPAEFTVPILRYHLLRGRVESARIPDESEPMLVQTDLTQPNMTQPSPVKLFQQAGELVAESGLQLVARVVEPDVEFAGGVVHVLDSSLVAPHNISATAWMSGLCKQFLQFMEETGLVSELESLHDATLFIPSDDAWERSESTLAVMSSGEKRALLRNHAVKGRIVYRQELGRSHTLATVAGHALKVRVNEGGGILVEDATVVRTDIFWSNGVAHMIDRVIMTEQVSKQALLEGAGVQGSSLTQFGQTNTPSASKQEL